MSIRGSFIIRVAEPSIFCSLYFSCQGPCWADQSGDWPTADDTAAEHHLYDKSSESSLICQPSEVIRRKIFRQFIKSWNKVRSSYRCSPLASANFIPSPINESLFAIDSDFIGFTVSLEVGSRKVQRSLGTDDADKCFSCVCKAICYPRAWSLNANGKRRRQLDELHISFMHTRAARTVIFNACSLPLFHSHFSASLAMACTRSIPSCFGVLEAAASATLIPIKKWFCQRCAYSLSAHCAIYSDVVCASILLRAHILFIMFPF